MGRRRRERRRLRKKGKRVRTGKGMRRRRAIDRIRVRGQTANQDPHRFRGPFYVCFPSCLVSAKGMDKQQRTEWFRRNKKTYSSHAKNNFDDGIYEETSSKSAHKTDDELYDYMPKDEWIIRANQTYLSSTRCPSRGV